MNTQRNKIEQMRAVTISREYGSGGGEIARRLAERLQWQLVDHQVVASVALELDVSESDVEVHDEHIESLLGRFLTSMYAIEPAMLVDAPPALMMSEATYHRAVEQVVRAAARRGRVVIVGRAGQVLLGDQRDVLHIRIVASPEQRMTYVEQREGLNSRDARARLELKDRDRARYLQVQYQRQSKDAHLYDLVINTTILDLNGAVDLIYLALQLKAARLTVPEHELGPAAGTPRYPGVPGDLRPPESFSG